MNNGPNIGPERSKQRRPTVTEVISRRTVEPTEVNIDHSGSTPESMTNRPFSHFLGRHP